MPLEIYRRHNSAKCRSRDTQKCDSKKRGCPIWVRGALTATGPYIREPLHVRDWARALDMARMMEAAGGRPAAPAVPQDRITVERWRDDFLANARAENVGPETLRKYKLLFRQLSEFARDRGIRFVTGFDLGSLQEFRNTWRDAPLSKSKKRSLLRGVFKFAVGRKWVAENPALGLGRIQVPPTQQVPFSEEEMEKILKAAKKAGAETHTFVLVMRYSGLRISDVCALRTDALQKDNHLTLRTEKTGSPVKVLLPAVVANALRTIPKKSPQHFFWDGRSKLPSAADLWRMHRLGPVFRDAGIKDAHPHRFRHTFAVELLRHGTPAGIVAALLGNTERPHSSLGYRPPAPAAGSPYPPPSTVSQPLAVM